MGKIQKQAQKIWDSYLELWEKLTKWKLFSFYTLHYTLLFIVLSTFIFRDFFKSGITFLCNDGLAEEFVRLQYINQIIRDGIRSLLDGNSWTIPLYDFRLGPMKLDRQMEPLQWLAVLCPRDRMCVFYDGLVLFRYYLSGLSFSWFGFYFKQKALPIMLGAVSYTFCGYFIWLGIRHPYFMAPIIFLPLLIVGVEKILRQENPFLFIIIIFLSLITDIYLSCILAILIALYVFIRLLVIYRKRPVHEIASMIGKIIVVGGIGVTLSGLVMCPTLVQILDTGRIGRNITNFYSLWKYSIPYYEQFLTYFLIIPNVIYTYTNLGLSVLSFPAICLLFLQKNQEKRSLQFLFLILTGFFLIPVVGYIMSGFNTIANRWCFAYAFCVSAILMFEISNFLKENKQKLLFIGIEIIVYFIICYFVVEHKYFKADPFVLLACCAIAFIFLYALPKQYHRTFLPICLIITCISVCHSSYLMYNPDQQNYLKEFKSREEVHDIYTYSQYQSLYEYWKQHPDEEFYHVSGNNVSLPTLNTSFYINMKGLTFRTNIYYQPYMEWFKEMEFSHRGGKIENYGIENQQTALTLANVKYYITTEGDKKVKPYNFKEVGKIQNKKRTDIILENEKFLPVGYTYDTYLPNEKYQPLFALAKQDAQTQEIGRAHV